MKAEIALGIINVAGQPPQPDLAQIRPKQAGDLVIERRNVTIYFPLMTCLLLSVLFSLVLWVVNR